ncbi:MAG: serine hydrolase domain-containing protein [Bacteroidota bacterium]
MKQFHAGLFVVIMLYLATGCMSRKPEAAKQHSRAEALTALFQKQHEEDLFHGGVVISHKGETIYENYLGVADRTWDIPVRENVKFDIASVNKSMTAALVMKAVEANKINLDDYLVNLLSGFTFEGHFHPEITLHHLLTHTSGLPDYDGIPKALQANQFLEFKRSRFTNAEYINFISQLEQVGEPGQQFHYSNFAYHLVAIILETTYAQPFGEILKDKLTKPLGLKNTISESKNENTIPFLAKAYNYEESKGEWHENLFIDLSLGRRIFSTASDLNRWANVMDNPGYLNKQSLDLMKTNHLAAISNDISYGYGWVIIDAENKSRMGDLGINQPYIIHGGSTEGYKALLVSINSGEYIISFLSNVGNRTRELELAKEIANIIIE